MKSVRIWCAFVVLLVSVCGVMAQEKAPQFLGLYEFHIKPGYVMNWENYLKKVVEAAEKTNAPQRWMAFQVAVGAPGGTYFIALPFEKWGDMDAWSQVPAMLSQAHGAEEGARLLEMGGGTIEGFTLEAYALLEDFSTNYDAASYTPNFYRVIRTEVKPEMDRAYRSLLARGAAAAKSRADAPMTIRRANVLGTNFRYIASTPFAAWSDIDAMQGLGNMLEESMGEVAAQEFYETLRKSIVKREMFVMALRRDLSRLPR